MESPYVRFLHGKVKILEGVACTTSALFSARILQARRNVKEIVLLRIVHY